LKTDGLQLYVCRQPCEDYFYVASACPLLAACPQLKPPCSHLHLLISPMQQIVQPLCNRSFNLMPGHAT